jgi:hypothetical protein
VVCKILMLWSDYMQDGADVLLIQTLASLALYDTTRVSHLATNLREEFIPACP